MRITNDYVRDLLVGRHKYEKQLRREHAALIWHRDRLKTELRRALEFMRLGEPSKGNGQIDATDWVNQLDSMVVALDEHEQSAEKAKA